MTGRKYSNRRVFPEQEWYEKLRPMLLFGQTAASRAKERGAPSAIVSDGGGIFYCNQAMDVYASLSIRKERIEPRQAWPC